MSRQMTADEADDHWSENGDTSVRYMPRFGPPSRDQCIRDAELNAFVAASLNSAFFNRVFNR